MKRNQKEKDMRREKILDVAFRLFVDQKIESVTMGEIAKEAGIGRATLFRYFPGKLELVIAVNTKKWKDYLDELDDRRPISSIGDIPAIGRLTFTLDSYIDMYQNNKDLLRYNDNFNHYVSHSGRKDLKMDEFNKALYSVNTRLHKMYEKAKEDNYLGTDDSMLVERTGQKIKMVEGSYDNIKITTPEDLYVGERILERNLDK